MLGAMMVVGVFNRITFPTFIIVPALNLLPHFQRKYVHVVVYHEAC